MSLSAGMRIGPFQIVEPIGAGAMGEVYRARDTRLARDVALKILPAQFASDRDRLARFQREARMLALLNHPHIAQIHGLEERAAAAPDGVPEHAIIMELVDGEDLAHRLARGRLAPREAIAIAVQIAEALDAAHAIGVIHRDLKPANVKVRGDGSVKLLDFGLARPSGPTGPPGIERPDTATTQIGLSATHEGVIVGTAAYMAPEQAQGIVADKRADIWALGVVLFEMLAGRRPFEGRFVTDVIAQVLERDPDWRALPSDTPPHVRRLLQRCLEKDRQRRMRDCGDVVRDLTDPVIEAPTSPKPAGTIPLVMGGIACAALGAAVVLAAGAIRSSSVEAPQRLVQLALITGGEQLVNGQSGRLPLAISQDGRRVVYSSNRQLYVRSLNALVPLPIAGTEAIATPAGERGSTGFAMQPILSPDGESVAYRQGADLKRVAVAGGAASVICACAADYGATWAHDDTILFGLRGKDSGVWRVPANGGTPVLVAREDVGTIVLRPQLLPGGTHVLYTVTRGAHWNESTVVVHSLAGAERQVLVDGGLDARYVASGHLIFGKDGALHAVKFDPSTRRISGDPVPVLAGVAQQTSAGSWGGYAFSVADDGTAAYVPAASSALRRVLVWLDRTGKEEQLPAEPRAYQYPRLSHDGRRVLLDLRDFQNDVWSWDLERATLMRVTHGRYSGGPALWNRGGDSVFYSPDVNGVLNVHQQALNGGTPRRLTTSPNNQFVDDLTEDGQSLVLSERTTRTGFDVRRASLGRPSEVADLLATPFNELNADVSANGRWIAYQSDESGRHEVYVRPFPDVDGGRWQVSTTGGTRPLWSRDGNELYFLDTNRIMNVVTVRHGSGLSFGAARPLFDTTPLGLEGQQRNFEVSADGSRFLMVRNLRPPVDAPALVLIQNWFSELPR